MSGSVARLQEVLRKPSASSSKDRSPESRGKPPRSPKKKRHKKPQPTPMRSGQNRPEEVWA